MFTSQFISFAEYSGDTVPGKGLRERQRKMLLEIGEVAEKSGDELYGAEASHLGELNRRLRETNDELREATRLSGSPPEHVVDRAMNATAAANRTMEFVNYEFVRRTFRRLYRKLAIGGLVVAVGVGTYVFQTAQSPPQDPVVNGPIPVRLFLKPGTDERVALGANCSAAGLAAVAVAGSLAEPEVVTQQGAGCNATHLTITEDAGVAVPVAEP